MRTMKGIISGQSELNCRHCNSFAQYLINLYGENALLLYWDYDKNIINPWNISYSYNKKGYIICQEKDYHGSYYIACNDFVKGNRCPYCCNFHGNVHPLDSLGKLLEDRNLLNLWSDKNDKTVYEYSPSSGKRIWLKCSNEKHNDYLTTVCLAKKSDFHCSECTQERKESFLQGKVRLYLETLGYTILHENNCTIVPKNPKIKRTNNTMPFDNEVKELNLIIEVHGIQHYEICGWHVLTSKHNKTTPEQELHKIQLHDRYKRFVSYIQGYSYLEIPYSSDNKQEEWKLLIENKIKRLTTKI